MNVVQLGRFPRRDFALGQGTRSTTGRFASSGGASKLQPVGFGHTGVQTRVWLTANGQVWQEDLLLSNWPAIKGSSLSDPPIHCSNRFNLHNAQSIIPTGQR